MSEVRRFAAAGLEAAARRGRRRGGLVIAAVDETGQQETGSATAGVKRHYLGCAGKAANGISTVHVSLVREKTGHALIGARQWIPREQVTDPVTPLAAGLPPSLRSSGTRDCVDPGQRHHPRADSGTFADTRARLIMHGQY